MVEDLIKRLRNWRDTHLSGLAREAADLIEQQAARLAALESERDALLAAAGKEAVAWFHNTARDGDKPVYEQVAAEYACHPAIPLCLCAPTAALEKGGGRDAWQPIDTAPKDGTRFIAWDQGHIEFFHWQDDDGTGRPVGWRDSFIYVHPEGKGPTHWQPLPAPPTALSQKAGENNET